MIVDLEPIESGTDVRNRFAQPGYLLTFLTERARLMAIVAGGVMALVLLFLLIAPRQYSGKSLVLIDPRKQEAIKTDPVLSGIEPDDKIIETELQMIQSRVLAEQVGRDLRLDRDPNFVAPSGGVLHSIKGLFGGSDRPDDATRIMTDRLMEGLKASRVGTSYAIQINWSGSDPVQAARIANQYAHRYIVNQIDVKDSTTAEVNRKIRDRLGELRQQLADAEARMLAYKQRTGLTTAMDVGNNSMAIATLNTQAALAKAQAAEQQALLAAAQRAGGESSPAAQTSPAVQALRAQASQIEAQAALVNARYGPDHPAVQQVEQQRREVAALLRQEINRSVTGAREAARAAAAAAGERAGSSTTSLAAAQGLLGTNNVATARLAALEREVSGLATLYQTYLGRYNETGVEIGLQTPDARLISRAVPPFSSSFPNVPLTLALGIFLAIFAALGAAIVAELALLLKMKRQEADLAVA